MVTRLQIAADSWGLSASDSTIHRFLIRDSRITGIAIYKFLRSCANVFVYELEPLSKEEIDQLSQSLGLHFVYVKNERSVESLLEYGYKNTVIRRESTFMLQSKFPRN